MGQWPRHHSRNRGRVEVLLTGRPHHRHDARFDCSREFGPGVDHFIQLRINDLIGYIGCTAFCSAALVDVPVSLGKQLSFASCPRHLGIFKNVHHYRKTRIFPDVLGNTSFFVRLGRRPYG